MKTIISAGRPGVEEAVLRAARECGIPTGGEEDGVANVRDSDATIYIHSDLRGASPGRLATQHAAIALGRPFFSFYIDLADPTLSDDPALLRDVLGGFDVVNVAGNRESRSPGIGAAAERLLVMVLARIKTGT